MSRQCACKKGYCSEVDNKCSNCRTKKEQEAFLNRTIPQLPKITVVNKHHKLTGEYIGRGSPLGNKWTHLDSNYPGVIKVATREEAIQEYKVWLDRMIANNDVLICNELNRLVDIAHSNGELNLMCTCKPKACHGDVIKDTILSAWK